MPHASDPFFRTFHALRIKGFAKADTVAEVADLPVAAAAEHLGVLAQREWAMFREVRQLWQLTPLGREQHRAALAQDAEGVDLHAALAEPYRRFLPLNDQFKQLCTDWQMRDGQLNDHDDAQYDTAVVARLTALDAAVGPILEEFASVLGRLAPYRQRLAQTCQRVANGETNMFTGVMCGSYHDVWMELHEDLILTQGIDRVSEGSF